MVIMQIFEEQFMIRPTSDGQHVSWHTISSSPSDDTWDMSTSTTEGTQSFDTDFDENASVQSTHTISRNWAASTAPRDPHLHLTVTTTSTSVGNQRPRPSTNGKRRKVLGDRTNNAPTLQRNHQHPSAGFHFHQQ